MKPTLQKPIHTFFKNDGTEVKFHAYSQKSFSVLATAAATSGYTVIKDTLISLLQGCLVDKSDDINTWPFYDVAMFFVQTRKASFSELVELVYNCSAKVEVDDERPTGVCGANVPAVIVIPNVIFTRIASNDDLLINITDTTGFTMRWPTFSEYFDFIFDTTRDDAYYTSSAWLSKFVVNYFDESSVYSVGNEMTYEETVELLEEIPRKTFEKFIVWFAELPEIKADVEIKCQSCGNTDRDEIIGMRDFFD